MGSTKASVEDGPDADDQGEDGSSLSSHVSGTPVAPPENTKPTVSRVLEIVLNGIRGGKPLWAGVAKEDITVLDEPTSQGSQPTALYMLVNKAEADLPKSGFVLTLVKYLARRNNGDQVAKADHTFGFTPLHCAIKEQRTAMVKAMCEAYPSNIDVVLAMTQKHTDRNCLHIATAIDEDGAVADKDGSLDLALFLVELASPQTLVAADKDGNTPLHHAADYRWCGCRGQFKLVTSIVNKTDEYMRLLRMLKRNQQNPDLNKAKQSPYQYHMIRRSEALKTATTGTEKAGKAKATELARVDEFDRLSAADISRKKMQQQYKRRPETTGDEESAHQAISPTSLRQLVDGGSGDVAGEHEFRQRTNSLYNPVAAGLPYNVAEVGLGSEAGTMTPGTGAVTDRLLYGPFREIIEGRPDQELRRKGQKEAPRPAGKSTGGADGKDSESPQAAEASDKICKFLRRYYLRTRRQNSAKDILYGVEYCPEKQMNVSLSLGEYGAMTVDEIIATVDRLAFGPVLQFVNIPQLKREELSREAGIARSVGGRGDGAGRGRGRIAAKLPAPTDCEGRSDLLIMFNDLRGRHHVESILTVMVDDLKKPAHTDDAIWNCLKGFDIDNWDWRKMDVCPDLILKTAPDVRVLHLYWSGAKVVLRGWSEEEALPQLRKLERIELHEQSAMERREDASEALKLFEERIDKYTVKRRAEELAEGEKKEVGRVFDGLLKKAVKRLRGLNGRDTSLPDHDKELVSASTNTFVKMLKMELVSRTTEAASMAIKEARRLETSKTGKKITTPVPTDLHRTTESKEVVKKRNTDQMRMAARDLAKAFPTRPPTQLVQGEGADKNASTASDIYTNGGTPAGTEMTAQELRKPANTTEDDQLVRMKLLKLAESHATTLAKNMAAELTKQYKMVTIVNHLYRPTRAGSNDKTAQEDGDKEGDGSLSEDAEKHEWLKHMEEFKTFLFNFESAWTKAGKPQRVVVAIIDDGIDLKEIAQFDTERVKTEGSSFYRGADGGDYTDDPLPYYKSTRGHGTVMALQILRLIPEVELYIIRLHDTPDPSIPGGRNIDVRSAEEAIILAIDHEVDIICMSWSIAYNEQKMTTEEKEEFTGLRTALEKAANKNILMFCSDPDAGVRVPLTYPTASNVPIFRIGAADNRGKPYERLGLENQCHFLFPGKDVHYEDQALIEALNKKHEKLGADYHPKFVTGSSVANALAAGLAGLILHCVRIRGHWAAQEKNRDEAKQMADAFKKLRDFGGMKAAFNSIGVADRYIQVWKTFGRLDEMANPSLQNKEAKVRSIISNITTKLLG